MAHGIIQRSFSINLKVMYIFGFYCPNKRSHLYTIYSYMMYLAFIIPIPVLGSLYLLLEENIDLVRVSENAFILAEGTCYIGKFLPFVTNYEKIKECILFLESPFFEEFNTSKKDVVHDCQKNCQRVTKIFLVSVTCAVSSWAINPQLWKNVKLPIDVWLPFDPTSNLVRYYSTYIYLVIVITYDAYSSGVIDPLISGLACQATSQLKILKYNLERVGERKNIYHGIKRCIDHHNAIIEFVKMYEDCFSIVIFCQLLGSVIVICVSCLQLSMTEPFSFSFLGMLIFLITVLAEILLFCYYGTTLQAESETLTDAIYMGEWYNYSLKSQKVLKVLMERAKKPMVVTAGKILDLSLVTFTMILKRSYSLLAVLQNYK